MDYFVLADDLTNGELAGAIKGKSRLDVLAILNKQDRFVAGGYVPIELFLQWMANNGSIAAIQDAANNPLHKARPICISILLRLNDPQGKLHMDERNTELLAKLVEAKIWTQDQAAELTHMTPASYSEQRYGRPLTDDDLARAGF